MESARKIEEKTPHEEIREKFQEVLDAMEDYIRLHPETVASATSERLKSIKSIANSIYQYYQKPALQKLGLLVYVHLIH